MSAFSVFLLRRPSAEQVRAVQLQKLTARFRDAVAAPLADGRLLDVEQPGDLTGSAEGVDDVGVGHGPIIGLPIVESIGKPMPRAGSLSA